MSQNRMSFNSISAYFFIICMIFTYIKSKDNDRERIEKEKAEWLEKMRQPNIALNNCWGESVATTILGTRGSEIPILPCENYISPTLDSICGEWQRRFDEPNWVEIDFIRFLPDYTTKSGFVRFYIGGSSEVISEADGVWQIDRHAILILERRKRFESGRLRTHQSESLELWLEKSGALINEGLFPRYLREYTRENQPPPDQKKLAEYYRVVRFGKQ